MGEIKISNEMCVIEQIIEAYTNVTGENIIMDNEQEQNSTRSRKFVEYIRKNLSENKSTIFNESNNVEIFAITKHNEDFRRSEFLFDVHACEIGTVKSIDPNQNKIIPFIKKSLIQIESEFGNETFDFTIDISKLVCGISDMKVIILPIPEKNKVRFFQVIKTICENIKGSVYLVLLERPASWFRMNRGRYIIHNRKYEIYKLETRESIQQLEHESSKWKLLNRKNISFTIMNTN